MITVYHADLVALRAAFDRGLYFDVVGSGDVDVCSDMWKRGMYVKVATLNTDDKDHAFYLTNNIDTPWAHTAGFQIEECVKQGCRSSSVGDIFDVNGKLYVVQPIGFVDMTDPLAKNQ